MATSADPVYLRVLEDLRTRINEGMLEPGARVPSRNAIIARYGVGETAAKHALRVLATEGLIEARAGSGSYVRKVPAPLHLEHDRLYFPGSPLGIDDSAAGDGDEQAALGAHAPGRRLSWEHQTELLVPPPHIALRLGLEPGMVPVTVTRYLLTADGEPVQLATSYEPAEITAGTPVAAPEQGPFAGRGVIERMRTIGIEVDAVVEELSVRPSVRAEAVALALPPGSPVLLIERVHSCAGRAVEAGEVVIAAGRFKLRYRFPVTAGQP